jgi:hypothetical protein
MCFPVAEQASEQGVIWLGESVFRAGRQGIDGAVAALGKIYDGRSEFGAERVV